MEMQIDTRQKAKEVIDNIGYKAAYLQLIEECGELIAATAKLLRKIEHPQNPTPKTLPEIETMVTEEAADVTGCCLALVQGGYLDGATVDDIMAGKLVRWTDRIKEEKPRYEGDVAYW